MIRKCPTFACLVYGVFTLLQACDSGSSGSDSGVAPVGGSGGQGGGGARTDAAAGGNGGTHPLADAAPVGGVIADAAPVVPDAVVPPTPDVSLLLPDVSVDALVSPGCMTAEACGEGQVCDHDLGQCDGATLGRCVQPPPQCPDLPEPVCGCDGLTYDNACRSLQAGVTVAQVGACPSTPGCATDVDCGPDDRCDPCAHGSCPMCDDCVAECVPHDCQSENQPACNAIRPICAEGQTAVVRDGCWLCVELATCEPPAPPGRLRRARRLLRRLAGRLPPRLHRRVPRGLPQRPQRPVLRAGRARGLPARRRHGRRGARCAALLPRRDERRLRAGHRRRLPGLRRRVHVHRARRRRLRRRREHLQQPRGLPMTSALHPVGRRGDAAA